MIDRVYWKEFTVDTVERPEKDDLRIIEAIGCTEDGFWTEILDDPIPAHKA